MSEDHILTEVKGRVGIITLNRPEVINAMSTEMRKGLAETIETWNEDPGVGAMVITGAGRGFCAGADISSFERAIEEGSRSSASGPITEVEKWPMFVRRSKPIVCAINGVAVGEGLTMTLPCDVRLAVPDARLSFRFVRLGLTPEVGSTHILPQLVGLGQAMELMLTGRFFMGDEAKEIGMVLETRPAEELLDRAVELASEIAEAPVWHLAQTKRLMYKNPLEPDLAAVLRDESEIFSQAQSTAQHREAMAAFREKRPPQFH